jgi:hypothetical protein
MPPKKGSTKKKPTTTANKAEEQEMISAEGLPEPSLKAIGLCVRAVEKQRKYLNSKIR